MSKEDPGTFSNVPDPSLLLRKEHAQATPSLFSLFAWLSHLVLLHINITHFMLIDERPKCILIVWENAMETKGLLGFRQPLQEGVDHRVKLLCLMVHTHPPRKRFPNMLVRRADSSTRWKEKKKASNLNWFLGCIVPVKKIRVTVLAFYECKKTPNVSRRPRGRRIHIFTL